MPGQDFTELELRITKIKLKKQSFLEKVISESNFELKIFTAVSDGVRDKSLNLELGVMPVTEGREISFGSNGFTVYRNRSGQIPRFLDANITILEDDSDIRNMAKLMSKIRRTEDFNDLTTAMAAAVANPVFAVGLNIAENLMDIGLSVLEENGDDLWLKRYFSFNYKIDGYQGETIFQSNDVEITLELFTA